MPEKNWSDEKLIRAIQGKQAEREAALRHIYQRQEWKQRLERYILQNSGASFDADDIFQDAILQLDFNIRQGKFEGRSALQTYFLSMARFIWLKRLDRRRPTDELKPEHFDGIEEGPDISLMSKEKEAFLDEAVSQLKDRCQKILKLYKLSYSMEEIAQSIGISSPELAKKETYRCRKRLRQFFEENPGWKDLFN